MKHKCRVSVLIIVLMAIGQPVLAKLPATPVIERTGAEASVSGPGMHYGRVSKTDKDIAPASPLSLNFAMPVPGEALSCEAIRRQRTTYRVAFIAGAFIGIGLVFYGIGQALDHIFSDSSAGSFETASGLFLIAGSAVGYAIVIPSLSRKYRRCRE